LTIPASPSLTVFLRMRELLWSALVFSDHLTPSKQRIVWLCANYKRLATEGSTLRFASIA